MNLSKRSKKVYCNIRIIIKTFLISIGCILLLFSFLLYRFNKNEEIVAGRTSENIVRIIEKTPGLSEITDEIYVPDYILNPDMEMPSLTIDGRNYIGIVTIPSIGVNLPIMKNLTYPNLKRTPCLWIGNIYDDTAVIAGHNYSSHFGNFKNVKVGDSVFFTDIDKNRFEYEVLCVDTIRTAEYNKMVEGAKKYDLTLFTCTYGGSSRVTLRCKRLTDLVSVSGILEE